jgi:Arc/MetJ family transcription regulator
MRTNIDINEQLIHQAMSLTGARTKREAVELGLQKLIQTAQRPRLSSLFGRGDIAQGYDYKVLRQRENTLQP